MNAPFFVNLPTFVDSRGKLTFIEEVKDLPFRIRDAALISEIKSVQSMKLSRKITKYEAIIALSGIVKLNISNNTTDENYTLSSANQGICIPPSYNSEITFASDDSKLLFLSESRLVGLENIENINLNSFFYKGELGQNMRQRTTKDKKNTKNSVGKVSWVHFNKCSSDIYHSCKFTIKRIFFQYQIPPNQTRGNHSHKECHQILIAVSGSFVVNVNDGKNKKQFRLDDPSIGLHIPPGVWADQRSFSPTAVCLVLASHYFEESDYIRCFDVYKNSEVQV